ncbi:MAG: hypothetical protein HYV07_25895 [Deltaproteobacteria bacterium]|nr:hypothetical protein [Deltaproteobacteria bacterium]
MKVVVHPEVEAVVRAWAKETDLSAGAKVLAERRAAMAPEHLAELRSEVSEISAEGLIELLALERGVTPGEVQEVFGISLLPKQVERLSAWLLDQQEVAEALGVGAEAWGRMLQAGLDRHLVRVGASRGSDVGAAVLKSEALAKSLLGDKPEAFQKRAEPGESPNAGLRGLASAMAFKKKK